MADIFSKVMISFMQKVKEDSPFSSERYLIPEWISCHDVACRLFLLAVNTVMALAFCVVQKPVYRSLILLEMMLRLGHFAMHGVRWLKRYFAVPSGADAGYSTLSRAGRWHFYHLPSISNQQGQIIMG
jgi:hypothetical protein